MTVATTGEVGTRPAPCQEPNCFSQDGTDLSTEITINHKTTEKRDSSKSETCCSTCLPHSTYTGAFSVNKPLSDCSITHYEDESNEDGAEHYSAFLYTMVAVTAVTGFLMGYDLCIVAVVLGPIRDHFGVCAGGGTEALGEAPPCIMNELFVAILAPGAMVSKIVIMTHKALYRSVRSVEDGQLMCSDDAPF
eukprot:Blabericola_migrator_1__3393@NODE_1_length_33786_cov_123_788665_g0_i0_p23_GENE_NODE_1_length_33786_cov_123_788665_g0_i0NODE_1_length_33786_cov_123_788665_g0_i0_p23_ORF_typecomplete_len192_score13_04_NODE_1_length_33786_cov_123_788665_g0_i03184532420